jgi:hypothetical protein
LASEDQRSENWEASKVWKKMAGYKNSFGPPKTALGKFKENYLIR